MRMTMLSLLKWDALNLKSVLAQSWKTPQLTPDISIIKLEDVIAGPLDVIPLKVMKFEVPAYQSVVAHFKVVEKLDRNIL